MPVLVWLAILTTKSPDITSDCRFTAPGSTPSPFHKTNLATLQRPQWQLCLVLFYNEAEKNWCQCRPCLLNIFYHSKEPGRLVPACKQVSHNTTNTGHKFIRKSTHWAEFITVMVCSVFVQISCKTLSKWNKKKYPPSPLYYEQQPVPSHPYYCTAQ